MKILFVAVKYDYGKKERGLSFEYYNFYDALVKMNGSVNEVVYFPIDEVLNDFGYDKINQKLLEAVEREKPNICFFVLLNDFFKKETILNITNKKGVVTLNWFTDDHWKFDNFSKHWAPVFTFAITTDSNAFLKYKRNNHNNIIKSQWGCNNFLYKPLNLPKIYDVTFVGQPHGNRKKVIEKLKKVGIKVECFGRGWPNGRVSQEEMIKIFNQSKINLNFANSSGEISLKYLAKIFFKKGVNNSIIIDNPKNWVNNTKSIISAIKTKQIKGRNFEIPGCGGFLLTDYADNLKDYYDIEKEIVCWKNIDDLVEKIRYYSKNDEERRIIQEAGYKRTMENHTYEKRFQEILQLWKKK